MEYLLDTNILIRLTNSSDPQYALVNAAVDHVRSNADSVYTTPQNFIELRNFATRPTQSNGFGLPPATADRLLERLLVIFPLVEDHPAIFHEWRAIVKSLSVSGRQVHDARLVAVMLVHGLSGILTLNTQDFERYRSLGIAPVHPANV